jgi:aryl-alcohol dehydrogenase-like predicted oxidoreductase
MAGRAAASYAASTMEARPHTRAIPATGEALPVVGLGTWQTFDVGAGADERAPLREVIERFFAAGGRLVDSSPMYGRAEQVAGDLLRETGLADRAFVATKVWTSGRREGEAQMERSVRLLGHVDLMQVHNLVDAKTHLATLRAWKAEGRVRYVGVTHYLRSAIDDLAAHVETGTLDFVQLPYSVEVRDAERRLLPAAAAHGTAVLVMRPFEAGALLRRLRGRPLPDFAAEIDCTSWAQLLLKWIIAHPSVTCPIPATSRPDHLADDLRAATGRLPDEALRRRIREVALA